MANEKSLNELTGKTAKFITSDCFAPGIYQFSDVDFKNMSTYFLATVRLISQYDQMKKTWVFCDNSDFNKRILVNPSQVKLINNSLVGQFFLRAHFPNVTRVNKKGETVFVVRDQFFRMDTKKKVNAKNLSLILPELRKYQNEVYDEYFVTKGAQLKTTS